MTPLCLHVLPRGDLIEHEVNDDCVCGPDTEFVDGKGQVVVHHSLDGREPLSKLSVEERKELKDG